MGDFVTIHIDKSAIVLEAINEVVPGVLCETTASSLQIRTTGKAGSKHRDIGTHGPQAQPINTQKWAGIDTRCL